MHRLMWLLIVAVAVCPFFLNHAHAQEGFPKGANALFIGHSFFVPIAKSFDMIAKDNGFSEHGCQFVFASGPKGLPGSLWNNEQKKSRVESLLAGGDIELFGMPTAGDRKGNALESYQHWIDLALSYNPQTRFFIGHCWIPGGPEMDAGSFSRKIEQTGEDVYGVVSKLRSMYPDTVIYYLNYGKVASVMRTMFDAGELDDVTELTVSEGRRGRNGGLGASGGEGPGGRMKRLLDRRRAAQSGEGEQDAAAASGEKGQKALFIDPAMGHAGPMMTQMMALVWLHSLYEADIDALSYGSWNAQDVERIISETLQANQRFAP